MIILKSVLVYLILNLGIHRCTAEAHAEPTELKKGLEQEVSVIIIGAGPAGIAAAAQLFENNITNITILEAENRIGGRVHSVPLGDNFLDLGAEWCEGAQGNVIYELVKNLNLLEHDPLDKIDYCHSSRKDLDVEFVKTVLNVSHEILEEPKEGVESSLGDYVTKRFNDSILKKYANDSDRAELVSDIFKFVEYQVLAEDAPFSWFDEAAENLFQLSEVDINLAWKGRGYKTILDVLTKKYPDPSHALPVYENVLLQKEVVKITLVGDIPEAECSDATKYKASHIIWTPSIGVLKHQYSNLFEPTLPKGKETAIRTLGFGAIGKVHVSFQQRWWSEDYDLFAFIWSENDRQNAWSEFQYGPKVKGRSWLTEIQGIQVNRYIPNVLCVWFGGEVVPLIEQLEDDIIIDGILFVFNKFLGHKFRNISKPQKIIREKWYSNKHFRGTYSYDTPESHAQKVSQRDVLAQPLTTYDGRPTVLFAGEATNRIHYGTVHGAIESGRREADRIINYYK